MLVWERFGCQLHFNAVVASVTKYFTCLQLSTEAVIGCDIGVTSTTYYYSRTKTVSYYLI